MRRPAQKPYGPTAHTAWAHPYHGVGSLAVFYNDGGQDPAAPPVPPTPKPGPPPTPAGAFTQDDLDRIAAKEKDQGKRAGAKEALEKFAAEHGFSTVDDAKAFIAAARQAEQDQLSEQEKREKALAAREADLTAREQAAIAREREANRRAVLVGLGATGDDLEDAAALLRLPDDADEQALAEAAAKLKERRPELFGATASSDATPPPAPSGMPAPGMPRPGGGQPKPGQRGLDMLRRRGKIPADA